MKERVAIGLGIVSTLAVFAASTAQGQETLGAGRLASFEMRWDLKTPAMVAARAQALVEIMTGQPLKRPAVAEPLKSTVGIVHRLRIKVPEAPQFVIEYLPEYDELRIVDTELSVSTAPRAEISPEDALGAARRAFEQLAGRQIVDLRHFSWDKVDTASTMVGGGPRDEESTEKRRIEFRFTLRRVLNGIEVANAGVRIAVHATGRISSLRLGGVSVGSTFGANGVEEPTGRGRWLSQGAPGDPATRFEHEVVPKEAKAKVAWARVMYVMPENSRKALVEPLYVVSYSLEFPTKEDGTVVSRRRTVGFSLVDPKAAPIDLTPPVRPPQTEKTRKEYAATRQHH